MLELIQYYADLLIIQYAQKPKIRATIEAMIEQMLADNIAFDIRDAFDIETAVGVQLDILGKYVGVTRTHNGIVFTGKNFAFLEYDNLTPEAIQTGFSDYTDFETRDGIFVQYKDTLGDTLLLSDEDYRVIIKLKILQNSSNHSHKEIDDGLAEFFGTEIRADSLGDMVMDYFVPDDLTTIVSVAIQKDVLPRPMGVNTRYLISEKEGFFGFATYASTPTFTKGFATYADVDTKAGNTLTYIKLEG